MVTSCIAHAAHRQLTAASCGFLSAAAREGQTYSERDSRRNERRSAAARKQAIFGLVGRTTTERIHQLRPMWTRFHLEIPKNISEGLGIVVRTRLINHSG